MGWCKAGMVKQGAVELRQQAAPLLSGAALCPTVDMMASFLLCEACPASMATWETIPLEGNALWAQPQQYKPHDPEALTSMAR